MSNLTINLQYLKDIENKNYKIDPIKFQKMLFIYNAIEDGWSLKKKNDSYIFSKKNKSRQEKNLDYTLKYQFKNNINVSKTNLKEGLLKILKLNKGFEIFK